MGAFEDACQVEKQAEAVLLPYIERVWPQCTYYPTRHHKLIQKFCGDLLVTHPRATKYIELKAERENKHGNLFVETWSNKERHTFGWFHSCQADWLWYYFLAERQLYIVTMAALREWARTPTDSPRLLSFPEKQQRRYEQLNDTWGRPVPTVVLAAEVEGFRGPVDPTTACR